MSYFNQLKIIRCFLKSLLRDKETTEQDSDMTHLLEPSDKEFEITIIMLKALVENVDDMHEQMGNFSREMKTKKRKKQMEMLQIKIMVRDKECFQSALNTAEPRKT